MVDMREPALFVSVTTPALPAAPPEPPTLLDVTEPDDAEPDVVTVPLIVNPPLPPPPPIDCAIIPLEPACASKMLPLFVTVTALPSPAAPPEPPTLSDVTEPRSDKFPATANPPLPPPPPTDCAMMPLDPRPAAVIDARLVT